MIEPVIVALTTVGLRATSTSSARINSAALPNVTLSRPPIVDPACAESCSVARRMYAASGQLDVAATHRSLPDLVTLERLCR